jgi:hypothetical protein
LTVCRSHVGRARPVSTPSASAAGPACGRNGVRTCLARRRHAHVADTREEFTDFERIPIVVSGRSAQ